MLLDAEHERLAAENTQAQAEIEASSPYIPDGEWSYPAGQSYPR